MEQFLNWELKNRFQFHIYPANQNWQHPLCGFPPCLLQTCAGCSHVSWSLNEKGVSSWRDKKCSLRILEFMLFICAIPWCMSIDVKIFCLVWVCGCCTQIEHNPSREYHGVTRHPITTNGVSQSKSPIDRPSARWGALDRRQAPAQLKQLTLARSLHAYCSIVLIHI